MCSNGRETIANRKRRSSDWKWRSKLTLGWEIIFSRKKSWDIKDFHGLEWFTNSCGEQFQLNRIGETIAQANRDFSQLQQPYGSSWIWNLHLHQLRPYFCHKVWILFWHWVLDIYYISNSNKVWFFKVLKWLLRHHGPHQLNHSWNWSKLESSQSYVIRMMGW